MEASRARLQASTGNTGMNCEWPTPYFECSGVPSTRRLQSRDRQTFSEKGLIINIFDFVGQIISGYNSILLLWHKIGIDETSMSVKHQDRLGSQIGNFLTPEEG